LAPKVKIAGKSREAIGACRQHKGHGFCSGAELEHPHRCTQRSLKCQNVAGANSSPTTRSTPPCWPRSVGVEHGCRQRARCGKSLVGSSWQLHNTIQPAPSSPQEAVPFRPVKLARLLPASTVIALAKATQKRRSPAVASTASLSMPAAPPPGTSPAGGCCGIVHTARPPRLPPSTTVVATPAGLRHWKEHPPSVCFLRPPPQESG
jgi:hypothetical protein